MSSSSLTLQYPIEPGTGLVTNWDDMELLWRHLYTTLDTPSEGRPVVLTETPLNPPSHRQRAAEVMFETFGVSGLYLGMRPVFALYTTSALTGLAVESGYSVTHTVPVVDGHAVVDGINRLPIGGRDVAALLRRALLAKEATVVEYLDPKELDAVLLSVMRRTHFFVAPDYDAACARSEHSSDFEEQYELPDGSVVTLGPQRFQCTEALFKPALTGLGGGVGIHEMCAQSVSKCDPAVRGDVLSNVVLAGGNTMFDGIAERLASDVTALTSTPARAEASPGRMVAAWTGASMMSSTGSFEGMSVTKAEYDENGAAYVNLKCV